MWVRKVVSDKRDNHYNVEGQILWQLGEKCVPMFIRGRYWVNFKSKSERKLREI